MLVSQKLAIAAHLHVLLRRKTGRVTDTEWMAGNLEYALEIVRFSRAKAVEDGHPELVEWADKLERAVMEPTPATTRPLAQSALQLLKDKNARAAAAVAVVMGVPPSVPPSTGGFGHSTDNDAGSGFSESLLEDGKTPKPREPAGPRYIGGIR